MRGLSAQQALRLLEHDASAETDRALALLQLAWTDRPAGELTSMSVSERDAALLELREATFGSDLTCRSDCPECAEALEFTLAIDQLLSSAERDESAEGDFLWNDYAFHFRSPSSADLAAAAECGTVQEARDLLVARCATRVLRDGEPASLRDTPEEALFALSEEMAGRRAAELRAQLTCPACGASWTERLDIASFLWEEVRAAGERILSEVHTLARAYGWAEAEILGMSPARRRLYVERVTR